MVLRCILFSETKKVKSCRIKSKGRKGSGTEIGGGGDGDGDGGDGDDGDTGTSKDSGSIRHPSLTCLSIAVFLYIH